MLIDLEFVSTVLKNKLESKIRDRERYCRQGDLRKIDMSLGAEDLLVELQRDFQWQMESHERLQVELDHKTAARIERRDMRRMARGKGKSAA